MSLLLAYAQREREGERERGGKTVKGVRYEDKMGGVGLLNGPDRAGLKSCRVWIGTTCQGYGPDTTLCIGLGWH